ncbi:MAG: class I SAM-dependent methyltransferase [Vicinamibacterales bacterium]
MSDSVELQRARYNAIYAPTSETWLYPRTAGLHAVLLHMLQAELQPGTRVLDVGCGAGRLSLYCARAGADVTGVDFSEDAIALARLGAHACGLTNARFEVGAAGGVHGGPFDIILLVGVLEHLPDPAVIFQDLARQLAPGGCVVAACPAFSNLRGHSYRTLGELFGWPMSLADLHQVTLRHVRAWGATAGLTCVRTAGALFEGPWTAADRDMRKRVPAAARDANVSAPLHFDAYLTWLETECTDVGQRLLALWIEQGLLRRAPAVAELTVRDLDGLDEAHRQKLVLYLTLDQAGDMTWSDVEPVSLLGGETIYFLRREREPRASGGGE